MKKLLIPILCMSTMVFLSCAKKKTMENTSKTKEIEKDKRALNVPTILPSGLSYTLLAAGSGKRIENGDKVSVHYVGKLLDSTVFDESRSRGTPFSFKVGAGQVIKGWDEGFTYLRQGDKAFLKIPPQLAYSDQAAGKIPPNSTITFEVEVMDVKEGLKPYDVKGKDTIKTASGLKYVMIKSAPANIKPSAGDRIKVHYTGYLLDGKVFDSSVERGDPIQFPVGKGQVIKGWDEGFMLLHKEEKARLIIPSHLAYGEQGAGGVIPPNATLVFDVEVIDISPKIVVVPFDTKGIQEQTTASGLKYYMVQKGTGAKAVAGGMVRVHYSGYLSDGKNFDSSVERGDPFQFVLGAGNVIPGWDEMLKLMVIGDKVRVVIPYLLAYGENGYPPIIPAKSDLTFDIELIDVMPAPAGEHGGHDHSDPNHKH